MQKSSERDLEKNLLGFSLGLIAIIIFAGTLPATHIALSDFDPLFLTFARALLAAMAGALCLFGLRRTIPHQHIKKLLLAGLLLIYGFPGFSAFAMTSVPASHGGVVLGILPLTTALFAALIGGEKPSPLFWTCSIVGTILVVVFAVRDGDAVLQIGDFWLLCAALSASAGYVISGQLSRGMPGWEVISWAVVLVFPISVFGTFVLWEPTFWHASTAGITALFYLGLFSMFLGFFAFNTGMALGGVARIGQLQLLQTFVTLALAAVLLNENITAEAILFALAVAVVVAVGQRARITRSQTNQ